MSYKNRPDPKKQLAEAQKCVKSGSKKHLAQKFLEAWLNKGLPAPEQEYHFHETRKWRFDFAWPADKLAVEIDGGSFVKGGHNRPIQQAKDYEKMNVATSLKWRVLRFNTQSLKDLDKCVRDTALVMCGEQIE